MSKRLTESQIIGILKEAKAGTPVPELCRKYAVGNMTKKNADDYQKTGRS